MLIGFMESICQDTFLETWMVLVSICLPIKHWCSTLFSYTRMCLIRLFCRIINLFGGRVLSYSLFNKNKLTWLTWNILLLLKRNCLMLKYVIVKKKHTTHFRLSQCIPIVFSLYENAVNLILYLFLKQIIHLFLH